MDEVKKFEEMYERFEKEKRMLEERLKVIEADMYRIEGILYYLKQQQNLNVGDVIEDKEDSVKSNE